MKQPTALF